MKSEIKNNNERYKKYFLFSSSDCEDIFLLNKLSSYFEFLSCLYNKIVKIEIEIKIINNNTASENSGFIKK